MTKIATGAPHSARVVARRGACARRGRRARGHLSHGSAFWDAWPPRPPGLGRASAALLPPLGRLVALVEGVACRPPCVQPGKEATVHACNRVACDQAHPPRPSAVRRASRARGRKIPCTNGRPPPASSSRRVHAHTSDEAPAPAGPLRGLRGCVLDIKPLLGSSRTKEYPTIPRAYASGAGLPEIIGRHRRNRRPFPAEVHGSRVASETRSTRGRRASTTPATRRPRPSPRGCIGGLAREGAPMGAGARLPALLRRPRRLSRGLRGAPRRSDAHLDASREPSRPRCLSHGCRKFTGNALRVLPRARE